MSDREKCIELLENVPEFKIGYVLAYLQGLTADEAADDAFCEALYQEYLNDTDPEKNDAVTIQDVATELGISL
ncbi:MAG: hypothetical protein Q4D42_12885 [Eubacteriales bacterium]|nr:hypothetical protein [Eubacteriales bacterium]